MTNKKHFLANRWMLTPLEIATIVAFVVLTIGGVFVSVQDALQLGRALNLNLTQTIILNQGIVNLQREVQLTHGEVTRLLGGLDNPPKPITRFVFVKIQVNNLSTAVTSPASTYTFASEDLALVQEIVDQSAMLEDLIAVWGQSGPDTQQTSLLDEMDNQLGMMETTIKQLVDRQAIVQREEIIQTRDSLAASQRTTLLAGTVLLLLSIALAAVFRRTLTLRLQQAVEADRLKSQLLANVSHELRTPISAIQGYSQLLNEQAYGSLTEKQQTTIQRILINTTQLKEMVNNLLDRAQIEQGKLVLRNDSFSPVELLETAHSALNILAATKNLELTSEITPDVPTALKGDVLRLQQILFNLVSNAIKFTESGGVHMRIFVPDKAHWALQVTDTGIGIAPDAQGQVFAPFWQIDSSATRPYRGSGLGLSIVKQLGDLMGSTINLTSQPEKRQHIYGYFPHGDPFMSKPLALIIEDDYDLSEIFSDALKRDGFETEIVRDGKKAIDRLSGVAPAIILLDLHLPHVDGAAILQKIHETEHFAKTAVIISTADAQQADGLRGNADLVLLKPVSVDQLRELAKRLLLRWHANDAANP